MGAPLEFHLAPDALEWRKGGMAGRTPYRRHPPHPPVVPSDDDAELSIRHRGVAGQRAEAADRIDLMEKPGRAPAARRRVSRLRVRAEPPHRRCGRQYRVRYRIAGVSLLARRCHLHRRRSWRLRRLRCARCSSRRGAARLSSRRSSRCFSIRQATSSGATGRGHTVPTRCRRFCCRRLRCDLNRWEAEVVEASFSGRMNV